MSYFVNGVEQGGTLAHLMARNPAEGLNEYLPELLESDLNFSVADAQGRTAIEYGNEHLNNYLSKYEMMLKLAQKLPPKSPQITKLDF